MARRKDGLDQQRIQRTLQQHTWSSLEEWVQTLDELADLSDDEIDRLVQQHQPAAEEISD